MIQQFGTTLRKHLFLLALSWTFSASLETRLFILSFNKFVFLSTIARCVYFIKELNKVEVRALLTKLALACVREPYFVFDVATV